MKFQNVKGTRDFYPEQMARRNWLIGKWREISRRSGFVEYDGPVFEYLELYTDKSGEGIVSELYNFEDRGGRKLALRPEMTPTLARMVAARANALPKPIKWFCVPNFFRAERPQRGRLREFWQWNVDIIGTTEEANNVADAECVMVALDFLREVGFSSEQVEMRISSRTLIAQLLETLGIEAARHAAVYAVLDKRDKMPAEVFVEQINTLGLGEEQRAALLKLGEARGPEGLAMIEQLLGGNQPDESPLGRLKRVLGLLKLMKVGDYCVFDPGIIRGLAYYTGIVFEAYSKGTLGRAICGGGRYDNLLKEVGGPPLSGVGFGMGDVIVLDQLEEMGLLKLDQSPEGIYVVNEGMERIDDTMVIVSIVRFDLKKPCNYSYKRTSVKKQMQEASAHNVGHVIIVGDRIALKNMATGEQVDLSFDKKLANEADCQEFLAELRTLLGDSAKST
ncbi:MAG: histidine--tRNA ligase [Planctomycetes bacterium]|nr:histidine--tRNA ligase [Planctomycetota bacterium]